MFERILFSSVVSTNGTNRHNDFLQWIQLPCNGRKKRKLNQEIIASRITGTSRLHWGAVAIPERGLRKKLWLLHEPNELVVCLLHSGHYIEAKPAYFG